MSICACDFVYEKERIEVLFKEDEGCTWYFGVIKKIHYHGEDEYGAFVECDIDYDDGDEETETRLYDCDYNLDKPDTWRFATNMDDTIIAIEETRKMISPVNYFLIFLISLLTCILYSAYEKSISS